MLACRATCLRPLVTLREFRPLVFRPQRQPAQRAPRLTCRPAATAAAADAADAGAAGPAAAPKYAGLSAEQQRQVDAYLDILLDWNQRMNLTAITERGECYERHVNDSLALLPAIDACLAAQAAARSERQQRLQQQQRQQEQQPATEAAPAGGNLWERGGGGSASSSSSSSSSGGSTRKQRGGAAAAAPAAADGGGDGAAAQRGPRLIDVGSGAGLPGIILAIARPDWEVTLLDSLQKRCKFTEQAAAAAGLPNVRVHWARAEDAGQDARLRQRHDVVIARAVAELRVLSELCLPLARPGGHWVAAKGAAPAGEVAAAGAAIGKLGGRLLRVEEVDSVSPEGRRTAVVVLKERATPPQYPRKPGVPGKKPL